LVTISFPEAYSDFIIGRGSIAVDGISLTVANEELNRFMVAIIPYTWNHTTFLKRVVGDSVNLEFDMVGKYVLRHIKNRES
jgi:riboflavin synthase